MKDHLTLLRAAKQLALRIPNIVFILAGRELDASNRELSRMVQHYDLGKRVFLLGDRSDIRPVYNACNLFVLNSAWGEGFPNVIGEALACEIPVVATDIGDCREVVDRFGRIVPPSQPDKLANAIHEFLRLEPQTLTELGAQARRSIQQRFALPSIARGYEEVYYQLLRIQSASSSKTPKYLSTAS